MAFLIGLKNEVYNFKEYTSKLVCAHMSPKSAKKSSPMKASFIKHNEPAHQIRPALHPYHSTHRGTLLKYQYGTVKTVSGFI